MAEDRVTQMSKKAYIYAMVAIREAIRMAEMARKPRNLAIAALLGGALTLAGCAGTDVEFNAPILEAAGINLVSKKKDEENLPDRPGLVLPPSTDKLPEPGTKTAAAAVDQSWPQDADKLKARNAAEAAAAREKYCREGKWDANGTVTDFNQNTGVEERCPSKLGEAISKSLGGGPASNQQ